MASPDVRPCSRGADKQHATEPEVPFFLVLHGSKLAFSENEKNSRA